MSPDLKKFHLSGKAVALFWFRHARAFFVILFFVAIGAGMYFWYDNVYRSGWTEEEKRRYAETAFQETVFKEADFRKAVDAAVARAALHERDLEVGNDLFLPLPGMEEK